jgi:alpha-tubulin suppressor-like RCC1 family protein
MELPPVDVDLGAIFFDAVSAGEDFFCARTTAATLRCWGNNDSGQLGYGNTDSTGTPAETGSLPPVDVDVPEPIADVTTGTQHTCDVGIGGNLRCWGNGAFGQLGQETRANIGDVAGSTPGSIEPVNVGDQVVQASAGEHHTCAVTRFGCVRCFGEGGFGALGTGHLDGVGASAGTMPPNDVPLPAPAIQVVAFGEVSCALLETGDVFCWGTAPSGELGSGIANDVSATPVRVDVATTGEKVVRLSPSSAQGSGHICALMSTGTVRCWGNGSLGDLGIGSTANVGDGPNEMPPADVVLGGTAVDVAAGDFHSCAQLDDGSVECWGGGNLGALGIGSSANVGDVAGEMPPASSNFGAAAAVPR